MSEQDELKSKALSTVEESKALVVTDQKSADFAGTFIRAVKALGKQIRDTFGPLKKKAKEAHQAVVDKEKEFLTPLKEAEEHAKATLGVYLLAERAKAEEARRKERERLENEERQRREEEERRLEEAAKLEEEGKTEEAEEVLDAPVPAAQPPIPTPPPPKVAGVHTRKMWTAEVTDMHELIQYLYRHPLDANLVIPNQKELDMIARNRKQAVLFPGVRGIRKTGVSAR